MDVIMTKTNGRFRKATFVEDAIDNIYSRLQNTVNDLTDTNCNLDRRELPDRERCVGRCISFRDMNNYVRCNHRADFKRLCKYHHRVCEILPIGYHTAEDFLGELHSDLIRRFGYLARGITMSNPKAKSLSYLFANNKENIFANGRKIDKVADDWERLASFVSYASVIDMIPSYEEAVLIYLTLTMIAEMRSMTILLCFFEGQPDLGHYQSFALNALLADKIGQFLGIGNRSDLRFTTTDVNKQMEKIEYLYLASKYIRENGEKYEFIRSSIPYKDPSIYKYFSRIRNPEGSILLGFVYNSSIRNTDIQNSQRNQNQQLNRFDMLDVFEELVLTGNQPLDTLLKRNPLVARDIRQFVMKGPTLTELYDFLREKVADYEAHSGISIM